MGKHILDRTAAQPGDAPVLRYARAGRSLAPDRPVSPRVMRLGARSEASATSRLRAFTRIDRGHTA